MKYYIKSVMLALVVLAVVGVPTVGVYAQTANNNNLNLIREQLLEMIQALSQVGTNNTLENSHIKVQSLGVESSSSSGGSEITNSGVFSVKYRVTAKEAVRLPWACNGEDPNNPGVFYNLISTKGYGLDHDCSINVLDEPRPDTTYLAPGRSRDFRVTITVTATGGDGNVSVALNRINYTYGSNNTKARISVDNSNFRTDNVYLDSGSSSNQAFKLLTPNGGEQWELFSRHMITWQPDPHSEDVVAYLEKKTGGIVSRFEVVGKVLPAAKGSIGWDGEIDKINSAGNHFVEPGEYYIRLENTKTGQSDRSDRSFKLLRANETIGARIDTINGKVPNETFLGKPAVSIDDGDTSVNVAWSSNSNNNKCTILLYSTSPNGDGVSLENRPTTGTERVNLTAIQAGGHYLLHVNCANNQNNAADTVYLKVGESVSTTNLSVDLKINGSSNPSPVKYGDDLNVTWTSVGAVRCAASGKSDQLEMKSRPREGLIKYWTDNLKLGLNGNLVLLAKPGSGYVPNKVYGISIECSDNANNKTTDFVQIKISDNQTQIPVISVTSPNSLSVFKPGDSMNINYTLKDFPRPVKVEIQLNKGADYPYGPFNPVINIASFVTGTGQFTWKVPSELASGNDYSLYVGSDYPSSETGYNGWSENFTITNNNSSTFPTFSNVKVNGIDGSGENTWYHDYSGSISWLSQGLNGSNVDILLCNNDKCWPQKTNITNTGEVGIKLYAVDKRLGNDYYIQVRKVNDKRYFGNSSTFSIGLPSISNITGMAGYHAGDSSISNSWWHGENRTITWESKGLAGVTVDIILCNNDKCWPFKMNTANDGSEQLKMWGLDKRLGNDYYLKIRKYDTEAVSGRSSTFTLGAATFIVYPNNSASVLLGFQEVLQKISELVKR